MYQMCTLSFQNVHLKTASNISKSIMFDRNKAIEFKQIKLLSTFICTHSTVKNKLPGYIHIHYIKFLSPQMHSCCTGYCTHSYRCFKSLKLQLNELRLLHASKMF